MENTVRYETDGKKLTAFFEGKINAANAAGIEKELLEQADGKEEVILDYEKLVYISSAGIRTLVRLKQTVGKVSIINVAPDIYEVLDNTGITNIIKVKRALREVSVENLEKVGQGGTASVYRLDEDRIIKVFISNFPFFMVDEERELSRKLFLEGVPTAVPYEIVRCGDHLGVIYEMLNANSIDKYLAEEPENAAYYIKLLADLQKNMMKTEIPDFQPLAVRMAAMIPMWAKAGLITEAEVEKYQKICTSIPDRNTYVHGDFHPGNVMKTGDELILIDMAGSSKGHPVFDLAGMCSIFYTLPTSMEPEKYRAFSGYEPEMAEKYWDMYLRSFFEGKSEEFIRKADMQVKVVSAMRAVSSVVHIQGFIPQENVQKLLKFISENSHYITEGFDY